jgi:hypothetical protein
MCIFFFLSGVLDRMEDFIALTPGEGRIRRIFRFFIDIIFRNIAISASPNSPLAYAAWPLEMP